MFLHIKYMSYPQSTIIKLCPTQTKVSTLADLFFLIQVTPSVTYSAGSVSEIRPPSGRRNLEDSDWFSSREVDIISSTLTELHHLEPTD